MMSHLGLPPKQYVTDLSLVFKQYAVVTAADEAYFNSSLDGIASAQTMLGPRKIIYYDLGLSENSVAKVWLFLWSTRNLYNPGHTC